MQLFLKLSLKMFRDNHTIGIVSEIVSEKSYDKVQKQITHVLALKKIVHSDLLALPTCWQGYHV
jgi:hypothetical protein